MHIVEAIIAKKVVTKDIEDRFFLARSVDLTQGYAMVPLTDDLKEDIDELVENNKLAYDFFEKLSYSICEVILESRRPYEVAYIEAAYFGGECGQSAIVWKDGKVVFGPSSSKYTESPINEALKYLGVRIIKKQDEFDELNLGWNRDTEKWYKSRS